MDSFVKPITVKRQEFITQLTDLINNSGLPYFAVESVMADVLHDVSMLVRQQYERDMKHYEEMKNAMNKKAVTDRVQDDGKEVQVS